MRDQRSLLNFAVLIIVATGTAVFVLGEAKKAVAEIDVLGNTPVYLGARTFAREGSQIETEVDTSTWKTYRNEKYGFEVKYPEDFIAYSGFQGNDIKKPNGSDSYICFAHDSALFRQVATANTCIQIFENVTQTPREWVEKMAIQPKVVKLIKFQGFDAIATGFGDDETDAIRIIFKRGTELYQLTTFYVFEEPYVSLMNSFRFR